jgi:hypothetical protein
MSDEIKDGYVNILTTINQWDVINVIDCNSSSGSIICTKTFLVGTSSHGYCKCRAVRSLNMFVKGARLNFLRQK